ncbi:MAG: hypothetical protein JXR95_12070 [Deltaproteobacteria bacterium]|nr:hypothetical protein [Deltaproteobacteria bacterium]
MILPFEKLDSVVDKIRNMYGNDYINHLREQYFTEFGKPAWDEPFYETRMNLFIEWMIIRIFPSIPEYSTIISTLDNDTGVFLKNCMNSQYGFFVIEAPIKNKMGFLRDLIRGSDFHVSIDPEIHIPEFPCIIQGRIIFYDSILFLAPSMIIHPESAHDGILSILDQYGGMDIYKLTGLLAKLHLRSWRYPHLNPKRFYILSDPLVRDISKQYIH